MPFIHPGIFWAGLVAASIPLIIHLLNRRRFRIRQWAAMKFLLDSIRQNRRRIQMEELILLLLRTLAVVMLAMALGRFLGCGADNLLGSGSGGSAIVCIVDDSPSMGQRAGGGSLLSAAAADLTEQVRKLTGGDLLAVLRATEPDSRFALVAPDYLKEKYKEYAIAQIQAIKPADGRCRLADALASAGDILEKTAAGSKQVWIAGDFRKDELTKDQIDAIRAKCSRLRDLRVRIVVMDYGRDAANNLTVESLEMVDRFALAGQTLRLRVHVRNNSPSPAKDVSLKVEGRYPADTDKLQQITVPSLQIPAIDAGATAAVECEITPPKAGPLAVTAQLPADEVTGDNSGNLAIEVRPALRVLAVDGKRHLTDPLAQESFFFSFALDPGGKGQHGAVVEKIAPEALTNVHLSEYDLVALMNVPSLASAPDDSSGEPWPLVAAMERYVSEGGGLIIFAGDDLNLDFYGPTPQGIGPDVLRGRFYNNGRGLLPLPLGPRVGDPQEVQKFFRLDPASLMSNDMLRTLNRMRQEGVDPTQLIRFYAFSPATEFAAATDTQDARPPQVLARFNDPKHSPAIVTRPFGRGSVVLMCMTANLAWQDWPQDEMGTYVATMNDLLMAMARTQRTDLVGAVGQPIAYELPARLWEARGVIRPPGYPASEEITATMVEETSRRFLKANRAVEAGVYWMILTMPDGKREDVLLARNVEPVEGHLDPAHRAGLSGAMGSSDEDFVYIDRTTNQAAAAVQEHTDRERWTWALAALLVLLAAETYLGQRFGHHDA